MSNRDHSGSDEPESPEPPSKDEGSARPTRPPPAASPSIPPPAAGGRGLTLAPPRRPGTEAPAGLLASLGPPRKTGGETQAPRAAVTAISGSMAPPAAAKAPSDGSWNDLLKPPTPVPAQRALTWEDDFADVEPAPPAPRVEAATPTPARTRIENPFAPSAPRPTDAPRRGAASPAIPKAPLAPGAASKKTQILSGPVPLPSASPAAAAPPRPRAPTIARQTAAPIKLPTRASQATGATSAYASLPPLRLSAPPPGSGPVSLPPPMARAPGSSRPSQIPPAIGRSSVPPPADGELEPETQLEGSARATAANRAMLALVRASRSYLIYDAANQAVRGFLEALQQNFAAYFAEHGELPLTVRPFELVLDGEVIYVERDRERSLALRLFRDGVRKIILDADTTWPELTKLLEILSIRFVGVRQDEDDIVTLLWKAGFQHITVECIEGFVPDDDDDVEYGGGDGGAQRGVEVAQIAAANRVPADFDLPGPELPSPSPVAFQEVTDERRLELLGEMSSTRLPESALELIRALLNVAGDPTDPLDFEAVAPLVRDTRDFLLSDSRLHQLLQLYAMLEAFAAGHPELATSIAPVVRAFFDAHALQKILRSVPHDAPSAPPELRRLLKMLPYDVFPNLLDMVTTERGETERRILREVLEDFLPDRADVMLARMRSSRGSVAADLLRILAARTADPAALASAVLLASDDDELQLEFLRLSASAKTDAATRAVLSSLLRSPSEALRLRTVEAIGDHREPGAFKLLVRHAEAVVDQKPSPVELGAIGRAITLVDAARALEQFREWSRPVGLMQRVIRREASVAHASVAAAGLAVHPSEEAPALLRELLAGATSERVRASAEQARRAEARARGTA